MILSELGSHPVKGLLREFHGLVRSTCSAVGAGQQVQ
jgi:hypothetical protein